jgi:GT2 family glycosyltransferase
MSALPRKLWRRLRFAPLYAALRLAQAAARIGGRNWPRRARDESLAPGIDVLIPERGTPDLLARTLAAAEIALAGCGEAGGILVVVNGAPRRDYAALEAAHPGVRWQFHPRALGYNGAIAAGLAGLRRDWVYLLNSDMELAPDALRQLLPYRQPQVFGVCSQIFFADPARRREETGWSDFHPDPELPCVYERLPDDSGLARASLYAGGGSSLCRTALLRRYAAASAPYSPFYWEDAEWGVRAWQEGWETLFCPASHAVHHHRGTVGRYYDPAEVARIVRRNALQFDLRHAWTGRPLRQLVGTIAREPEATQRELAPLAVAWGAFRRRRAALQARARGLDYGALATAKFYPRPRPSESRPRVLLVSPFALFPPSHGGARRVSELVQRLAGRIDFILLGDERSLYDARSYAGFAAFRAVHLVEGRGDRAGEAPLDLPMRLARHAHPKLRAELRRLLALYRPDVVQVEFMELAALIDEREPDGARWLLALHDVYLDGGPHDALQLRLLRGYDALTAVSAEDLALLPPERAHLIANGAPQHGPYQPSPPAPRVLFMGPFRYRQNREGILAFLETAWPAVRAAVPDARLTILGGAESACERDDARLRQPGVELISDFVDPAPYLAQAALTINPQQEIRGSALKVVESLLAGRICVSTRDGARGFDAAALPGLLLADGIAAMAAPLVALLPDAPRRHGLERPTEAVLARHGWDGIAETKLALYRELARARA